MEILGIDIGGSGIKGAPVDVERGELVAERHRIPTPQPATPDAVAKVVGEIVRHFDWTGPVGCTFPAVVQHGIVHSAANVDDAWIGVDGQALLERETGCDVVLLNDADAAGIAEMRFGAGRGREGVVFLLTLGTGIGSAIFVDGTLLPNSELGHLQMRGTDAEGWASSRTRDEEGLDWEAWSERLNEVLAYMELLFSPDLFILGGGISKEFDEYGPLLKAEARIIPAALRNEAGIVGAALAARRRG